MASIMKRGDSYSVRYKYKDHSGKPCEGWESFKTKKEAQERKITVEKELLDGTFLVPDTMTVEEMLYKWIPIQSIKHKWSPKTYTQSVATVQNLIVPYIGKRKVQELRTYDIEKFYATLAKTPCGQYVKGIKQKLSEKQKKRLLSSTSIHEVHTLLKTAFSYAVEWDLIHKIPLPRDAPKVNIEERTIWDEKTMLAALQTIENPALHLAVHMSMILSLREGEILGLQPSDLDFDAADGRGTISVSKTMLFRLPNGLAVEPVLIRKKFLKWQDAHPEFPRIVFHGLRHSSATYQLMISGGDVKAVQGTTGHATADMLVNTYAHIQQSSRVELGRKFEEGFYAKSENPSPQAVPAEGEPTISMTALLELLKNADPEVKAQLRLALMT